MTKEQEEKLDETKRMLTRYFETEQKRTEYHNKIDKIYEVLVGIPELKRKGLIEDMEDLKKFADQVMKLKWYSLGVIGMIVFLYGIIKAIKELFA